MPADDSVSPSGAELMPQPPLTVSLSASRWSLLDKILHLLNEETVLILLTGESGAGKSYFLDCIAANFLITHTIIRLRHMTGSNVSQQIARQLSLTCDLLDSVHLTTAVQRELAAQLQPVLLLCDDAEKYDDATLEQIRQFNNLAGTATGPLKIVLCGTRPLLNRLNNRKFDSLTQRIPIKLVIEPLDYPETASYITARIQTHFAIKQIPLALTDRDIAAMYKQSTGMPQKLNGLVDSMLAEAADRSTLQPGNVNPPRPVFLGLIMLSLVCIASFFAWEFFRSQAGQTPMPSPQRVTPIPAAEEKYRLMSNGLKLEYAQFTHQSELLVQLEEGERWLSSQSPDTYAIQLYALLNPDSATAPGTHLVALTRNGQKLYGIYQGGFPTAALARQAAENLQAGYPVRRPLVKKIAEIQTEQSAQ